MGVNMLRNPVLNQRAEQNHFKVKTSFEGVSMLRNPEAAARFVRTLEWFFSQEGSTSDRMSGEFED